MFLFTSWSQVPTNSVQKAIDVFKNDASLASAAISFEAYDINTGATIASCNNMMALPPASTVKLFTTATAFQKLGPYYKPETRLYVTGDVDSLGVLHGDIIIRGGGDPALGSRFFEKDGSEDKFFELWLDTLISLGIKEVKGSVLGDASDFGYQGAPAGWTWGDMGNYYGSGPSGLVLFDNMQKLYFNTGSTIGDTTSLICTEPYIDDVVIKNYVKSAKSSRDNSYVFGAPYGYDRFIEGSLPVNKESFMVKASLPDPEKTFASEFQQRLALRGVKFRKAASGFKNLPLYLENDSLYNNSKLIYTNVGKTVNSVAYWTNMRSVNLFAEQLLCLIAYKNYGRGTSGSGAAYVNRYWGAKVGSGLTITDGSGLSRNNAVSAHHFVKMLSYMSKSKNASVFKKTLPVAGKSGTLRRVCAGQSASGRMYAKSGTMSRIKAYSGYVDSKSGKKIAFAIIVNNHTCKSSTLVKKMEKVFNAMAIY